MPDDEKPEIESKPETPPESEPAYVAALRAENARLGERLAALNDTVTGALSARNVAPSGSPAPGDISPQLRQVLRNKGLSDAEITANAPLILPFVEVFAPELVALVESRVGSVDERVTMREMLDDTDAYPDAALLKKEIKAVLADAKKAGRPMSLEAAYHTARSLNIDKVNEAANARRAESRGADESALAGVGHRGASSSGRRAARDEAPRTAADLAKMSREERMKFYESHGDAVIH